MQIEDSLYENIFQTYYEQTYKSKGGTYLLEELKFINKANESELHKAKHIIYIPGSFDLNSKIFNGISNLLEDNKNNSF